VIQVVLPKHVTVALSKQNAKLYRRLWASRNDLEKAHSYAAYMLKKKLHFKVTRTENVYFLCRVFTEALVIAYGRAFVDFKDPEELLTSPTDEQMQLHERLLDARNQLFAHSDLRRFDITPGRFGNIRTETVDAGHFELTERETHLLVAHLAALHRRITLKMHSIADNPASS
jgi:hypothetical protein